MKIVSRIDFLGRPIFIQLPPVDAGVEDRGGGSVDVPEGADVRFEQVYPDKELPYYR